MFNRIHFSILPLILLGFLGFHSSQAQCPVTSINLADSTCEGDTLYPSISTPSNMASYEWDFCPGDFFEEPVVSNLGNIENALTYPRQITMVRDGGTWLGFISNLSASVVYRLNFGSSLLNTPSLDTLNFTPSASNPGNSFSKIRFRKEGSNWYGIQVTEQERMVIFNFGNSLLSNNISATVLNNPLGLMDNARDIVLVEENDSVYGFVINLASEDISLYRFGTSISGGPISGFNESIIEDSNLLNNSSALEVIKYCDDWLVFVSSFATDNLVRVNMGDLSGTATAELLGANGSVGNPQTIELVSDAGQWHLFIKTTQGTGMMRGDFGSDLLSSPSYTSLGTYGNTINGGLSFSLDMVKDNSQWFCFVANAQNGSERIVRLAFPDSCSVSQVDSSAVPAWEMVDTGLNYISFTGIDSDGNSWIGMDSVFTFSAPSPSFTWDDVCEDDSTHFSDLSTSADSVVSWFWDFGDGNTSTLANPAHLYADTGTFSVALTLTSVNNCAKTTTEEVTIFPTPVASFSPDTACQRALVTLNESSTSQNDSIVSWYWQYGNDTATGQGAGIDFDSTGLMSISLVVTTSMGCIDSVAEDVFVKETPDVAFDIGSTCNGDSTAFVNSSSTGSGALSYSWDFGDGSSSNLNNPTHLYSSIGTYQSKLIASSTNGCADSSEVAIVISNPPLVNFFLANEPACTDNDLQFIDSSSVLNGSIIQWDWTFSNGNSSSLQNPILELNTSGTYVAYLEAYSGTNCSLIDSLSFDVLESPSIAYDIIGYCEGQEMTLTDLSQAASGDPLDFWSWTVNGVIYNSSSVAIGTPDSNALDIDFTVGAQSGCQISSDTLIPIFSAVNVNSFTLDNLLCTGIDIQYDATTSIDPQDNLSSQTWMLYASGTLQDSLTASSYTVNTPSDGAHELIVTIETDAGCTATDTSLFLISQSPTLEVSSNTTCLFDSTFFIDNYSGSNYAWDWTFGDGFTTTADDPSHIFVDTGFYVSILTLTDVTSGCFDTATTTTLVIPEPSIHFGNEPLCHNTEISFYDSSSIVYDSLVYWHWKIEDGMESFAQNPLLIFDDPGSSILEIEVRSAKGCTSTLTEVIEIQESPSPLFDWDPKAAESPAVITLNSSEEWDEHFWVISGTDTLEQLSPQVNVEDSGSFSVDLYVTDENGCSGFASEILSIKNPRIDLAITELQAEIVNGYAILEMTITNYGTLEIDNPIVKAYANEAETVTEAVGRSIRPGESVEFEMSSLFPTSATTVSRACAFLQFENEDLDRRPQNNSRCISESASSISFHPYPNPGSSEIFVPYFLSQNADVFINIFDSSGKLVGHHQSAPNQTGFHTVRVETLSLQGINSVQVVIGSESTTYQILFDQ